MARLHSFCNFDIFLNNTREIRVNNFKKLAFKRRKLYKTYSVTLEKVGSQN